MKAIHYDAEGDILSVTFTETKEQEQTGVELSDNIVLYYNPKTEQPLKLILLSYQAMLNANTKNPILLNGLSRAPANVRSTIITLLHRAPLTTFLQLEDTSDRTLPGGRLVEIFTRNALQTVTAD